MRRRDTETEETEEARVTGSLAALAVLLALVVLGLFLVQALQQKSALENCLMAGRVNCGATAR